MVETHSLLIISPLKIIIKTLEEAGETNYHWLATLLIALSRACEEAKSFSDAAAFAQNAFSYASKCSLPGPSPGTFVHLPVRTTAFKTWLSAAKNVPEALNKLRNEATTGSAKDLKVSLLINGILLGVTKDPVKIVADLKESFTLVSAHSPYNCVLLAQAAVSQEQFPLAQEVLSKVAHLKHPKIRSAVDLVECDLRQRAAVALMEMTLPLSSTCLNSSQTEESKVLSSCLNRLVSSIEFAVRTIASASHSYDYDPTNAFGGKNKQTNKPSSNDNASLLLSSSNNEDTKMPFSAADKARDNDVEGLSWATLIEYSAQLIWNTSLPLMQNFPKICKKALLMAATVFESIQSTLVPLRVPPAPRDCRFRDGR
jgi:hypothetical protein